METASKRPTSFIFLSLGLVAAAVLAITLIKPKPGNQKIGPWEIKISNVERTDLINQQGSEFFTYAAKDGQKLVVIDLDIKNSSNNESILGVNTIKLETNSGQLFSQDNEAKGFIASPLEENVVKPGKNVSGKLVFSIPEKSNGQRLQFDMAGKKTELALP